VRYKKALLGDIDEENADPTQGTLVEVKSVEIVCPDRPQGNIELSFHLVTVL